MPLPHLWEAMKRYFAKQIPPSLEEVGAALGISAGSNSPLFRLFRALQAAEVRCMDATQKSRTLAGLKCLGAESC